MKSRFLFPAYFRPAGVCLALIGFVLGYFALYQQYSIPALGFGEPRTGIVAFFQPPMNLTDELALVLIITGLLFTAFARLKNEDELTAHLRLDALHRAILFNYILIFGAYLINNIFIAKNEGNSLFEFGAWSILSDLNWIVYALFSPLLIFIARFYYQVYRYKRDKLGSDRIFQFPRVPFRYIGIVGSLLSFSVIIAVILEPSYPTLSSFLPEPLIETAWYVLPLCLIFWAFSKDHSGDEYLKQLRLESWQITFYIHYVLVLLATLTIYGATYLIVMLFTVHMVPLLFLLIYAIKKLRAGMGSKNRLVLT